MEGSESELVTCILPTGTALGTGLNSDNPYKSHVADNPDIIILGKLLIGVIFIQAGGALAPLGNVTVVSNSVLYHIIVCLYYFLPRSVTCSLKYV